MKIEGKEIGDHNFLDKVTYVPKHVNGNAGHPDCEQGVIIHANDGGIKVLYCTGRNVQMTNPEDLVWG